MLLVVSHWYVDSDATVALVTGAFLSLEKDQKLGRASALQVATLSLIDGPKPGQSHPSAWAPFVLAGNGGR